MTQVLGNNTELQQGLFDIMNHNDADWEPGDWARPIVSPDFPQATNPTNPDTLRPENELQLAQLPSLSQVFGSEVAPPFPQTFASSAKSHLPPMRPNACSSSYGDKEVPTNTPLSFGSHPSYRTWSPNTFTRNGSSYPTTSLPDPSTIWQNHASSSSYQYPGFLMLGNANHDPRLDSALQAPIDSLYEPRPGLTDPHSQHFHGQSQHTHGCNFGSVSEPRWQYGQDQTVFGHYAPRHPFYPHEHTASHSNSERLSSSVLASGIETSKIGMAQDMSPSDGPCDDTHAKFMGATQDEYSQATTAPSYVKNSRNPVGPALQLLSQGDMAMFRVTKKPSSGPYIHAICGKSFPTKSAVKKHHWGPKSGDMNTTRGCWAKHKKPAIAW